MYKRIVQGIFFISAVGYLTTRVESQIILINELKEKAMRITDYRASYIKFDQRGEIKGEIVFKGGKAKVSSLGPEIENYFYVTPSLIYKYIPSQKMIYSINLDVLKRKIEPSLAEKFVLSNVDIRKPFSYLDVQEGSAEFNGVGYRDKEKIYLF